MLCSLNFDFSLREEGALPVSYFSLGELVALNVLFVTVRVGSAFHISFDNGALEGSAHPCVN